RRRRRARGRVARRGDGRGTARRTHREGTSSRGVVPLCRLRGAALSGARRGRGLNFAFNASAYDALASGAKARTIGLTAALLRAAHAVRLYAPRGLSFRSDVEFEHAGPLPRDRFVEIETPLDPTSPLRRAIES